MPLPDVLSVVIPTWNRAPILRQTLESLTHLSIPSGMQWELFVVDNNCTDDTAAVIDAFTHRLPIRRIEETRPGVNHARNAGVQASRGQYIVFTDDDTLVDPQWLQHYANAFVRYPEAELFGGPIVPTFETSPPRWLEEAFPAIAYAFGNLQPDAPDGALLDRQFTPFGANMGFRATVFSRLSFDPQLGPSGKKRINGSETDLVLRLLQSGAEGRWVPSATVQHRVRTDQMTIRFLRKYFRGYGAARARAEPVDPAWPVWYHRPRWIWRDVCASELRFQCRRRYTPAAIWIEDLKRASILRGTFHEWGNSGRPS
jgi:GT2 family glycosyltransferase